jgi:hypothetical protein
MAGEEKALLVKRPGHLWSAEHSRPLQPSILPVGPGGLHYDALHPLAR